MKISWYSKLLMHIPFIGMMAMLSYWMWKDFEKFIKFSEPITSMVISTDVEAERVSWALVYRPVIRFEYKVNDITYTAENQIEPLGIFSEAFEVPFQAQQFLKDFPVDKEMPAYYNPNNHSEALLGISRKHNTNIYFFIAIVAIFYCVFQISILGHEKGWIKYDGPDNYDIPSGGS